MNTRLTLAAAVATVLASIALYPLLQTGTWFWTGIGAVIVVALVGAATRRRAIPVVLCFLAAVGGLLLYLNVVFAGRQSWAGLLPTGASLHHLQLLVKQAMAETSKYAPAIPARPGIVLVTVAGIGFVAVLTDVLAVRLHRPAIAGLPLLVLFCVPLTTDARPGAVGATLVFCAGMVGYLGLLSADGRHRRGESPRLRVRQPHHQQQVAGRGRGRYQPVERLRPGEQHIEVEEQAGQRGQEADDDREGPQPGQRADGGDHDHRAEAAKEPARRRYQRVQGERGEHGRRRRRHGEPMVHQAALVGAGLPGWPA